MLIINYCYLVFDVSAVIVRVDVGFVKLLIVFTCEAVKMVIFVANTERVITIVVNSGNVSVDMMLELVLYAPPKN